MLYTLIKISVNRAMPHSLSLKLCHNFPTFSIPAHFLWSPFHPINALHSQTGTKSVAFFMLMPGDMCAKSPFSFFSRVDLMRATQKSQWSGSIKRIRVHTRNTLSVLLSWYWWLAIAIVKRYDAFTALSGGAAICNAAQHMRERALYYVCSGCDSDTASPLIESPPRACLYFSIRMIYTNTSASEFERRRVAAQTKRHTRSNIFRLLLVPWAV